jgi:cold-inducible RNA-binding protein
LFAFGFLFSFGLVVDTEAKKLYVGNFPFATTADELKAYFGQYGTVKDVYMPMNRDGTPRGFAFVTMKDEDVEKALEATNGIDFQGRPMVVSIPLPPGEKLQRKECK